MKQEQARLELLEVANSMLGGKIHLIEGCRKICSLRHKVGDADNQIFIPIRGVESETDHYPLGDARKICDQDYLKKIDAEMEQYIAEVKNTILQSCKEIIKVYANSI